MMLPAEFNGLSHSLINYDEESSYPDFPIDIVSPIKKEEAYLYYHLHP